MGHDHVILHWLGHDAGALHTTGVRWARLGSLAQSREARATTVGCAGGLKAAIHTPTHDILCRIF